jgi:excisionase family DNA binding protein
VGIAVSTDPLDPILLSRKQAASLLSISLRAIDYLIQRNEIKTRRVGKRVLIRYDELKRFARADHPDRIVPGGR